MSKAQQRTQDRFIKQLGTISELARKWQQRFTSENGYKEPIGQLLEEFASFASDYFGFFLPQNGEGNPKLAYELNTALSNLQNEWAVISRACEQRHVDAYQEQLRKADLQAKNYYDRFKGFKENPAIVPITYFEKVFEISRYLFTPYPVISIPLQVFDNPNEWLALAHELGHFIYWNSPSLEEFNTLHLGLKAIVQETILNSPNNDSEAKKVIAEIWENWIEEIFADICGTLLTGPKYAVSAQQIVLENNFENQEFAFDDEVHPPPYLRPLIALETLQWVASLLEDGDVKKSLTAQIDQLKEQWKEVEERGKQEVHQDSGLKMDIIDPYLRLVVWAILGDKTGHKQKTWVDAKNQPENLGKLFDFTAWLEQLPGGEPIESLASTEPISSIISVPFNKLHAHLEKKYKEKNKIRQALLDWDLSEARSVGTCGNRTVKWVGRGKGYYNRC